VSHASSAAIHPLFSVLLIKAPYALLTLHVNIIPFSIFIFGNDGLASEGARTPHTISHTFINDFQCDVCPLVVSLYSFTCYAKHNLLDVTHGDFRCFLNLHSGLNCLSSPSFISNFQCDATPAFS